MTHFIELYSIDLLQVAAVLITLSFGANILQAIVAISRKGEWQDTTLELHRAYKSLSEAIAERDRAKAETQRADQLRDRIERAAKVVENERDNLRAERATLYFRNSLGQIVPITSKPLKPHTLKHGMTVKDPTPEQATRIFAEARKSGMDYQNDMPCKKYPDIHYINRNGDEYVSSCTDDVLNYDIYISATEFVKRIKGEVQ